MTAAPYTIRPIDEWPGELTRGRQRGAFRATLGATHSELRSELLHLRATEPILEIAISPLDLRVDGGLRGSARPEHPGVILAIGSKHGPLRWACDRYVDWADNLRAITLTLNALRAVDRWGATRDAEQYKGWAALPPGGTTRTEAQAFIDEHGGSFAEAAKRLHPDKGGDPVLFGRLLQARGVLRGDPRMAEVAP